MLEEHLVYVSDANRLELYRKAVAKAVRAGDRVVDLGCGTGILGILCLEAGAARVTFIVHSTMIDVARQFMELAGFSKRCVFLRGRSQRLEHTESADAVVCDHVGYFGFDYGLLDILQDAKRRLQKPGGILNS